MRFTLFMQNGVVDEQLTFLALFVNCWTLSGNDVLVRLRFLSCNKNRMWIWVIFLHLNFPPKIRMYFFLQFWRENSNFCENDSIFEVIISVMKWKKSPFDLFDVSILFLEWSKSRRDDRGHSANISINSTVQPWSGLGCRSKSRRTGSQIGIQGTAVYVQ